MHMVPLACSKAIMAEELSDSTMEALYGTVQNAPPAAPQKSAPAKRHHHRKSKPFVQQSSLKPYLLVSAASLALILAIFIISK